MVRLVIIEHREGAWASAGAIATNAAAATIAVRRHAARYARNILVRTIGAGKS
jgi:hypothetical protein